MCQSQQTSEWIKNRQMRARRALAATQGAALSREELPIVPTHQVLPVRKGGHPPGHRAAQVRVPGAFQARVRVAFRGLGPQEHPAPVPAGFRVRARVAVVSTARVHLVKRNHMP